MSFQNGAPPNSFRPDTPLPAQNERPPRLLQDPNKGSSSPMTNELLVAARKGFSKEMERILMEKGTMATTVVDRHGRNCLHLAAHYGHITTVSVILRMEIFDINVTSKRGFTPLHEASAEGHLDIVLLLLAMGAFHKARSKEGWTALMSACYNGHYQVVKILLAFGIDANTTNVHGFTALHVAAWKGNTSIIELLIKEGALLEKETQNGKTALDIAKEERQHEAVTILQAASVRESEKPFYRIAALEGQIHMFQEKLKTIHAQHEESLSKEKTKSAEEYAQMKQKFTDDLSQARDEIKELKKTIESFKQSINSSNQDVQDEVEKSCSTPTIQITQNSPVPIKKKNKFQKANGAGSVKLQAQHRASFGTIVTSGGSPFMAARHSRSGNDDVQETMDILGLDSTNNLTFEPKPLLDVTPRRSLDGMRNTVTLSRPNDKLTITQLVEESIHKPGSMAAIRMQLKADGLTPKINKKFRELPSMPENLTTPRPSSPLDKNILQD